MPSHLDAQFCVTKTDESNRPADFATVFRAHADAGGSMNFARFMALALYHPTIGYYRRTQPRIGHGPGTDFFTASTSGPLFGEIVTAACVTLLGDRSPAEFTFVEIGAESPLGVLTGVAHPFAAARTIAVGEDVSLSGRCIVFSNELFDAQPFRRFVFRRGGWREIHVTLVDAQLKELEMPATPPVGTPVSSLEGYVIDAPLEAAGLAERISHEPWTGLFVGCDYGKSWRELSEACPAGTARAYFRHQQSNDLLARPGEQDLTCHICWDWLIDALLRSGFRRPIVESQEAFFIRHAADFIAKTSATEAAQFSRRKLSLMQLLHPSHLGQKFQVLHAFRD